MSNLKTIEIKQTKLLYFILKSNAQEVKEVISSKKDYYCTFQKIKKDKRDKVVFENGIPKSREINATKDKLQVFQKIISKKILSKIVLPPNIKGGVKGSDNISNAKAHLGKHYKFKTDIKKYFPSISHTRVYKMLIENGFSSAVASIITHITTYKYQLPQGTPTSTNIANLVFIPIDKKIIKFCNIHKITYTRYVDDLTFSSHFDFRNKVNDLIKFIIEENFAISDKKTYYKAGSMEITGVYTKQNTLDATTEYKELVKDQTIDSIKTKARKKYIERIKTK
jgi:RNA-directed DNA polymerase